MRDWREGHDQDSGTIRPPWSGPLDAFWGPTEAVSSPGPKGPRNRRDGQTLANELSPELACMT